MLAWGVMRSSSAPVRPSEPNVSVHSSKGRYEELVGSHLLLEAQKTPFVASLHHLADESGGRDKADCQALLAGGQTETEGDMSFARATGAERDDVLAALDPFTARQFQYLHLVELRNGGEVEAVEAFDDRELRRLDTAFDLAAVPLDHLPLGKTSKVSDMVHAFGRASPGQLLVLALEGRQLEGLEVMGKQNRRGIVRRVGAHAASPASDDRRRMYAFADVVSTVALGR